MHKARTVAEDVQWKQYNGTRKTNQNCNKVGNRQEDEGTTKSHLQEDGG